MLELQKIKGKYPLDKVSVDKESIEKQLSQGFDPSIDMSAISAQLSYLTLLYEKYTEIYKIIEDLEEVYELSNSEDAQLNELATGEIDELESRLLDLTHKVTQIEIEHDLEDPDDSRSVILEIRAGAGGEEAALFAADLYRMYANYSDSRGWEVEMITSSVSETGGFKEITAFIKGKSVFEKLKYESGVHRVQRIPSTESGGRIHTSTASVAIMPEAKDVEVDINEADLRIDTMRSSGAGGQSVNKTSSAVRITHLPSGIVVSCQDTKVQQQNKEKAMQILTARLYEMKRKEQMEKRSELRSSQIGNAMRAEKIRTYNYPQSRITDHRIKSSWHDLEAILNGEIDDMLSEVDQEMKNMLLAAIKENRAKENNGPE